MLKVKSMQLVQKVTGQTNHHLLTLKPFTPHNKPVSPFVKYR